MGKKKHGALGTINDLAVLIAKRKSDEAKVLAKLLGSANPHSAKTLEGCGTALLHLGDLDAALTLKWPKS